MTTTHSSDQACLDMTNIKQGIIWIRLTVLDIRQNSRGHPTPLAFLLRIRCFPTSQVKAAYCLWYYNIGIIYLQVVLCMQPIQDVWSHSLDSWKSLRKGNALQVTRQRKLRARRDNHPHLPVQQLSVPYFAFNPQIQISFQCTFTRRNHATEIPSLTSFSAQALYVMVLNTARSTKAWGQVTSGFDSLHGWHSSPTSDALGQHQGLKTQDLVGQSLLKHPRHHLAELGDQNLNNKIRRNHTSQIFQEYSAYQVLITSENIAFI